MGQNVSQMIDDHFSQYSLRRYSKGQILIHAGDNPEYIFYIVSGKVRQYDISFKGDEIVVNIFKQGSFFPMFGAITQTNNRYFFDTETEVALRMAPLTETVSLVKSSPDIMFDLLTRVYVGTEGVLGRMVQLMSGTARTRLIYELVTESKRFGEKNKEGASVITITESDLAARAGMTRETVSREMQKLSLKGLVHVGHKHITLVDVDQLEKILLSEDTV